MKTCIFIVGDRDSGKTSIVKSLTGCSKNGLWYVRTLSNKRLSAFVLLSAITEFGGKKNPPHKFPKSLEDKFHVKRHEYKILICPFELKTWGKYSIDKYIQNARRNRFNVKVAVIKQDYTGQNYDITNIRNICRQINVQLLPLDITRDYVIEANRIRNAFYPR